MGALCTFLYYILIFFNTSTLLLAFEDNSKMESSSQQTTYQPFDEPAFNLIDYNTELSVLVKERLPENIGRVKLFRNYVCSQEQ